MKGFMRIMRSSYKKCMLGSFLIILSDQLTKYIVSGNLSQTSSVTFIPYLFNFVYVKNTGAAFSILSKKTAFLGVISVLFCLGVLIYWYKRKPSDGLLLTALTLLFSGAFGNAIDRIARGYVIDFIEMAFINFPVINLADIAITSGAVILMIYLLFFDKEGQKGGKKDN